MLYWRSERHKCEHRERRSVKDRMKDRKTFRIHGRHKDRRNTEDYTEDYTDEYIEALEDGDAPAEDDFEDEEAYIVAYSSDEKVVEAYTSEEMQEYAQEYEEYGAYKEEEPYEEEEQYEELEEYEESAEYEEYEESSGYEEEEPYEELEEYEETAEYEEEEPYEELEEYEESAEYEEYEESSGYEEEEPYEEAAGYEEEEQYEELEEYEEAAEYEEEQPYEELEEYEAAAEYEEFEAYEEAEDYDAGEALFSTKEINIETFVAEDYAEDTESYYESGEDAYYEEDEAACYESDEYYEDEYYEDVYNEDSFDTAYGGYNDDYANDLASFGAHAAKEPPRFVDALKERLHQLTAFDAVLAATGVVVLVAGIVILSMFLQSKAVNKQIAALAPLGGELKDMGIAGEEGLLAMSGAALSGNFAQDLSTEESSSTEEESSAASGKVNVSFVSVEKDLKIRFTDEYTGELITGTVFEVTLTNAKGKKLVLTDDDMDGIIYAQNVNAGVFDAIITSTEKYTFPSIAQQVTVKDKVEYVVVNVQDEVKTEKQINVAAEDTEKNDAAVEAEVLKDTVEWVESTKTPVSGTESYLLVDQNTIADPSQTSRAAVRMLFDTINVSLDKSEVTLSVGAAIELKGTSFENSKEGDTEYQYTAEWKSSDEEVVSVSGGKVTAKAAGTAVITYTVTKKTITTTTESKEPSEETLEISLEEYAALSDEEKENCTPIKDDADQTIGYMYKKVTAGSTESTTSETTETASAECIVTVQEAEIVSGSLELQKSADSCAVGETLTVKPVKLVYKKQDGSTETITENFPSIAWDSDDVSIAAVGTDGVVSGVKAGKVHITGRVTGIKDAEGKELDIRCSVEVEIKEGKQEDELSVSLDRTSEVYLAVGGSTTLVATVTNYESDAGVTWETSDKKVATVDEKGVVTGVAPGSATITAVTKEKDAQDKPKKATCVVTINSNASSDTTTKLKDKNGNQIYIKNDDGSYKEAVYSDYYNNTEFYIAAQPQYIYTGWQTIDGKTYFYDKNGNVVTGTQIIQGVTYNFGTDGAIATSVNGSTFGIDVSRHNGTIDWKAVKASGVDYVIIRCGYRGSLTGVLIEDQSFRTNIKGATAAGLKVGVYVFSQAVNEVEAVKEASLAVSLVKGYNLTYPIFIDTESSGGRADKIDKATRTAVVNAFCQTVASAGYKPGIYASKTWFEDKLNMGAIGNYKIWLAQYSTAPTYKGRYDMWQYSSKGKISGISTKVDLNYSYLGY